MKLWLWRACDKSKKTKRRAKVGLRNVRISPHGEGESSAVPLKIHYPAQSSPAVRKSEGIAKICGETLKNSITLISSTIS
jgi:hypothetical protein